MGSALSTIGDVLKFLDSGFCGFCMRFVGSTETCTKCGDVIGKCCTELINGAAYCLGCR